MDYLLLTCLVVSFLTTYLLMPYWIRAAIKTGLVGKDVNLFVFFLRWIRGVG